MLFTRLPPWPVVPHTEIVKRARIVAIDDADFPYLTLFRRDGYTIERWPDVRGLQKLEQGYYDIILLDLHGVGARQSADQGFGILRHLRETNPAQIVIAYSNAEWSLEYQPFFELADSVLQKTADYVDFKRTVDDHLTERYSLGFYIDRVDSELSAYRAELPSLRKKTDKAIRSRRIEILADYLSPLRSNDGKAVDRALQVTSVAIRIAQLWMT